jgi:hypothetical protein
VVPVDIPAADEAGIIELAKAASHEGFETAVGTTRTPPWPYEGYGR